MELLANVSQLKVKNTFLECEEEDDLDFLEMDTGFARASTAPVMQVSSPFQIDQMELKISSDFVRGVSDPTGGNMSSEPMYVLPSRGVGSPMLETIASQMPSPSELQLSPSEEVAERHRRIDGGLRTHDEPDRSPKKDPFRDGTYMGEISVGSAGHPDSCKECHFFMFAPEGCNKGADCVFCHAIHPRKNAKKTRRVIRRLDARMGQNAAAQEAAMGAGAEDETPASSGSSAAPEGRDGSAPSTQRSAPSTQRLVEPAAAIPAPSQRASAETVSLRYSEQLSNSSDDQPLLFLLGVRANFAARLSISAERLAALEASLTFSAEPRLPQGVSLHPSTGTITGVPSQMQESPSLHTITASVPATGPCGIPLGALPLACCTVAVRVIDLQRLQVTWSRAQAVGAQRNELLLKVKQRAC